ncbi:hypothetical protein C1H46_023293 [Malus baccata]|uniref:Uncharacterized protein n=1 Tax=Malus baccata TaxID=106549 RepID=A0A540LXG4_MALBA|nr:hypothetical protein C1H46_023293 [Malus baccata]
MTYFHKLHNKLYCLIVNVDELWSILPQEAKDDALLVDVTQTTSSRFWARVCCHSTSPLLRSPSSSATSKEIELEIERTEEG